jgi:hypothetical protein
MKIIKFIYDFMKMRNRPEDMLNDFEVNKDLFPVYIPTNPSLPIKDIKITDAKNIGETRKMNKY